MRRLAGQLGSYGMVGVINMSLGVSVIGMLTVLGAHPLLCNILGYMAGLTTSFFLNRRFTFAAQRKPDTGRPFLISFIAAYLANVAVLYLSMPLATHAALIPQLLAIATYNIVFFVLMRVWVFG